jgi:hypothetical protein
VCTDVVALRLDVGELDRPDRASLLDVLASFGANISILGGVVSHSLGDVFVFVDDVRFLIDDVSFFSDDVPE